MAQARELMNEGLRMRDRGDAAGALDKLRGAHALAHTPITGLELGRDYLALGKLVEARETFLSVARIPPRPDETSRSAAARTDSESQARQLHDRIPTLTVRVTGVPLDTVTVTIDDALVPNEALAAPRLLNPGAHAVVARSTAGGRAEAAVNLKERETRDIELKIAFSQATQPQAPASPASSPTPATPAASLSPVLPDAAPAASTQRSHALDWTLIAGGAAIAIAGGVLMGVEVGKASDAVQQQNHSAYDATKTPWTVGLVGTIAGGALAASGVILFAATAGAKPTSSASLWVGAGAGSLRVGGTW